jgi:hypothetical protein
MTSVDRLADMAGPEAHRTMTTAKPNRKLHQRLVCCGCGCETDMLQWVEGHRFCLECCSALSKEVGVRVERGAPRRPGSEGALHSALLDILEERPWTCEQDPELAQCLVPPMRLMLVAGFHRAARPSEWILVARDGELTVDLLCARLFPFTAAGSGRAFVAAGRWTNVLRRDCAVVPFVARVLVTGDPAAPDAVVEAWRLEGDGPPEDRRYPFDRD